MKVVEAVEHMTKFYLRRIVDSFTKDFPKPSEERAREIIVQNTDELTDPGRIKRTLSPGEHPYSTRVLHQNILEAILNRPERQAREEEVVEAVIAKESKILSEAENPDSLTYEDESALETLRDVLEVAVQDDEVTTDELHLIDRLRRKLGVQQRSKRILLAQVGHFPQTDNETHTPSELSDALNALQKLGVLFYCNKLDGGLYVIPEELAPGVKEALGIEMSEKPWRLLLSQLTVDHLGTILQEHGLPMYPGDRRKEDQIQWIVHAGIPPSEALDALTIDDLYDVLGGLAGAKVSGSKAEKIDRLIDYFVNLVIKDVPEEASPAETYYEYLVELAARDRESVLANDVVSKDREMEAAFEKGTRYLFEEKLGLELLPMSGSDHPDGMVAFDHGDLLMWDTKSKEGRYVFPNSHLRQFKRYIRDSQQRVSCFLIVAPEMEEEAETKAELLKSESRHDTDVALVSAENLKWLAENWRDFAGNEFDPEVFNTTGILDRNRLEQRMKLLL